MGKINIEELREWKGSPAGGVFWEAIKDRYSHAISQLRNAVRKGDWNQASYHLSQADAAEEILQLPDALIEEQREDNKKEEAK